MQIFMTKQKTEYFQIFRMESLQSVFAYKVEIWTLTLSSRYLWSDYVPLSEYNNFLTLLPCSRDNANQIFKVRLTSLPMANQLFDGENQWFNDSQLNYL